MEKLVTLTAARRDQILSQLNEDQIAALSEFTRFTILSKFHTRHYLHNTDWHLTGMVVDPWYHRAHPHRGENLYCDCGRRLKNQFILRSRSTGRELKLGITHFQQHASIPMAVAQEIQAGINEVHLYMDSILLSYAAGHRFPQQLFRFAADHGGFKNRESTILYQRCQLFSQVHLPLYRQDEADLKQLVQQLKQGRRPRLTKQQIQSLLKTIATDWRQIDQQLMTIVLALREAGLQQSAIHRIRANGINYALQRRRSRFLVYHANELTQLTLTKARAQLAIKLRELAYYLQITTPLANQMAINRRQAEQILNSHHYQIKTARSFGVREAYQLVASISN